MRPETNELNLQLEGSVAPGGKFQVANGRQGGDFLRAKPVLREHGHMGDPSRVAPFGDCRQKVSVAVRAKRLSGCVFARKPFGELTATVSVSEPRSPGC